MQHHLVVQECFNAIVRMREAGDDASCANDVHSLLCSALQRLLEQPEALGLPPQDAADTAFAIAALADEVAMRAPQAVADAWQYRRLQTDYFNESLAGDLFYERLAELRTAPQGREPVLFAYYTALALGFEGRLGDAPGREQITTLIAGLRQVLEGPRSSLVAPLSPYPVAKRSALPVRKKGLKAATWALVAASALAASTVLGMQVILRVRVQQVVELATLRATQLLTRTPHHVGLEDKQQ